MVCLLDTWRCQVPSHRAWGHGQDPPLRRMELWGGRRAGLSTLGCPRAELRCSPDTTCPSVYIARLAPSPHRAGLPWRGQSVWVLAPLVAGAAWAADGMERVCSARSPHPVPWPVLREAVCGGVSGQQAATTAPVRMTDPRPQAAPGSPSKRHPRLKSPRGRHHLLGFGVCRAAPLPIQLLLTACESSRAQLGACSPAPTGGPRRSAWLQPGPALASIATWGVSH